jgi:hypothetical protein
MQLAEKLTTIPQFEGSNPATTGTSRKLPKEKVLIKPNELAYYLLLNGLSYWIQYSLAQVKGCSFLGNSSPPLLLLKSLC